MVHKPEISEPGSWNGFPSASVHRKMAVTPVPPWSVLTFRSCDCHPKPRSRAIDKAGVKSARQRILRFRRRLSPRGGARRHRDFTAAGRDSFPSILTYPEGEDGDGDGGGDLMGKVGEVTRTPPEAKGGSAICTRTLIHPHRRNNSCFQNSATHHGPKQEDAAGLRSWPVWKQLPLPY